MAGDVALAEGAFALPARPPSPASPTASIAASDAGEVEQDLASSSTYWDELLAAPVATPARPVERDPPSPSIRAPSQQPVSPPVARAPTASPIARARTASPVVAEPYVPVASTSKLPSPELSPLRPPPATWQTDAHSPLRLPTPPFSTAAGRSPIATSAKGKGRYVIGADEEEDGENGSDASLPPDGSRSPAAAARPHPSPAPRPPSPPPPPDDVAGPGGRALRKRNIAQLNPFSFERAKYMKTLVRNDWQDAVVLEKVRREETDEERRAKRARVAQKAADDLEGWLDLEGRPAREGDEDADAGLQLERADLELIGLPRPKAAMRPAAGSGSIRTTAVASTSRARPGRSSTAARSNAARPSASTSLSRPIRPAERASSK